MLEIIILYQLCKRIGKAAREKGRPAGGYQLMLVLFWFGGEIGGGLLVGLLIAFLSQADQGFEQYMLFAYLAAIIGAIVGAWLAFRIVANLPKDEWEELGLPSADKG